MDKDEAEKIKNFLRRARARMDTDLPTAKRMLDSMIESLGKVK